MRKNKYLVAITFLVKKVIALDLSDEYVSQSTIAYIEMEVDGKEDGVFFYTHVIEAAKHQVFINTGQRALKDNMTVTGVWLLDSAPVLETVNETA